MPKSFDLPTAFGSLHTRLDSIQADVTETRTHMNMLIGNGQPGRIGEIEQAVDDLKAYKNRSIGYTAAIAGFLALLGGLAELYFHTRH